MSNQLCVEALCDLFPKGFFLERDEKVQDFLIRVGQLFNMVLDRAHDVARHTIEGHKSYFETEPEDFGKFKIRYSKNKMTVYGLETKTLLRQKWENKSWWSDLQRRERQRDNEKTFL